MQLSSHEQMLMWIVLFPLIGAVLNGIGGCFFKADRKVVVGVACLAVAGSFAFALIDFVHLMSLTHEDPKVAIVANLYQWFQVQLDAGGVTVPVNVRFTMDALSGIMTVMVTGIGLLIHIYSAGYMSEEPSYARFFAYLNLFTASMLVLVLASNMPLMFVGWEGVGLCSYLLIGFWYENPTYAAAGKKAFVVNRIGDFGAILGMFILFGATQSFEFAEINAKAAELTNGVDLGMGPIGISIATLACLFLFLGCTGKSAQIPLYVWLPDAMAGPTPVSALIHAATMVTSGVYLCCRLSPVFVQSPSAMAVIAVVGTLTALVAASIALVQNQLKKILAYSTVSQLGFMFAAVGCGAFGAGIFHVFTHAFFKACLFLCAGSVMHAIHAHGNADLRELGGMKKWLPITHVTFAASCAAIAGVPLTSGFFSKDEILLGAFTVGDYFPFAPWLGKAIFAALVLGAFTTAFYMFRLYFLTFWGEKREHHAHGEHADAHGHEAHGEPHESPLTMTVPLMVLAVGALLVGFLGMPHWWVEHPWWSHWLESVVAVLPGEADHGHASSAGMIAMAVGTVAGLSGIGFAFIKYANKPWHAEEHPAGLHLLMLDKWRVDELYGVLIVRPMELLAKGLGNIDRVAVDGLTKLAAYAVQGAGFAFTRAQTGVVHAYGAAMVVGMAAVAYWVLYPHPHIDTASKGDAVHFVAGAGYGYQYRWDFDGDGEHDTEWSKDGRDVSHAYDAKDRIALELVLTESTVLGLDPYRVRMHEGEHTTIETRYLGGGWQTDPDSTAAPTVRMSDGLLFMTAGASTLRVNGQIIGGDEAPIAPGSEIQIGRYAKLRVDAVIRASVEVKSAFGYVGVARTEVVITPGPPEKSAAISSRTAVALAKHGVAR